MRGRGGSSATVRGKAPTGGGRGGGGSGLGGVLSRPSLPPQPSQGRPKPNDDESRSSSSPSSSDDEENEERLPLVMTPKETARIPVDSSPLTEVNDFDAVSSAFLGKYSNHGGDLKQIGRTADLVRALVENSLSCIICLDDVVRDAAVWSCPTCHVIVHLPCIDSWIRHHPYDARDMVLASDGSLRVSNAAATAWMCPKCRSGFGAKEMPKQYTCFCGKVTNPPNDHWLLPHTCGEVCGRSLSCSGGHACLLQCHPGPCPPCPITVASTACFCGRQQTTRRCSERAWTCAAECGKTLDCTRHRCTQPCHAGACAPCGQTASRTCSCGTVTALRPCAEAIFHCTTVCGRPLTCGRHTCEALCCGGQCGACVSAGARLCPCGKTKVALPCDVKVPPCRDTCKKLLPCGLHRCAEQCHYGDCPPCRHVTPKTCRCGRRTVDTVCSKDFKCDSKCHNLRDCQRHPCKRRCCDGSCPPCTEVCGRLLPCGNCKCPSTCHAGACFPCTKTAVFTCACGSTTAARPCGTRNTAPPRCTRKCSAPPTCHHSKRQRHECHVGPCPPCTQTCGLVHPACAHECPLPCHDEGDGGVGLTPKGLKGKNEAAVEVTQFPSLNTTGVVAAAASPAKSWASCPPCTVPVLRTCVGLHSTGQLVACSSRPWSCSSACGLALSCTNHTCSKTCHVSVTHGTTRSEDGSKSGVSESELMTAAVPCELCTRPCEAATLTCDHRCSLGLCHPGPCPPCEDSVSQRCHCKALTLVKPCSEVESSCSSSDLLERLWSCGTPCPRLLPCTHACEAPCHSGACPTQEGGGCLKRLRNVRCGCGFLKGELPCHVVVDRAARGLPALDCTAKCEERAKTLEQEKAAAAEAAAAAAGGDGDGEDGRPKSTLTGRGGRKKKRVAGEVDEEAPTEIIHSPMVVSVVLMGVAVVASATTWIFLSQTRSLPSP